MNYLMLADKKFSIW